MHVCCNRPEGHNKVGKTSSFRSGPGPCSYKNIGPSRQPAPLLLSCRKPGRRSRAPSIHLLLLLLTSSPAENLGRDGGERVVRAVLRVSPAPPWSWPRGRTSSSSSTTSSWAKNRWAKRFDSYVTSQKNAGFWNDLQWAYMSVWWKTQKQILSFFLLNKTLRHVVKKYMNRMWVLPRCENCTLTYHPCSIRTSVGAIYKHKRTAQNVGIYKTLLTKHPPRPPWCGILSILTKNRLNEIHVYVINS